MTTAAKPTFNPARGGTGRTESDLGALSKQYSSRDLPSHTKLKYRQEGQGTSSEVKARDFKRELEEKERAARDKKTLTGINNNNNAKTATLKEIASSSSSTGKRQKTEPTPFAILDADDPTINDDDDEEEEDESNDEEEDDLEMELNKIKKEREAERSKMEEERKAEEERVRIENIIKGNPLLTADKAPGEFRVKRRWDDDVVFKNCAREDDIKKPRQYINDTLRSDFHKKFMDKYIK